MLKTPADLLPPTERVRVVVLPADGAHQPLDYLFTRPLIRVGRPDPAAPARIPELNLLPDLAVSREHATLKHERGRWFIDDPRSKHGTTINGRQVRGAGPTELPFGSAVRTGDTVWTLIPDDWWFVAFESMLMIAPCARVLNYASYHCGIPIMPCLFALNAANRPSRPVALRVLVPGLSTPVELRVAALDPETSRLVALPQMAFDTASLRAQIEPVRASIRIDFETRFDADNDGETLGGRSAALPFPPDATPVLLRGERELTVLGFWDWPYEPALRRTIAAFVTPRDSAVEHVVNEAQSGPAAPNFRALLRSGGADAEREILRTIYELLAARRTIHYEDPKLNSGIALAPYQTLRSPHRILASEQPTRPGRATCIDLAVLFAACLENAALCPLVVFLGAADETPRHALVAVWVGSTPGGRPILDDVDALKRDVRSGRMHVVECTGVTRDTTTGAARLSFAQATAEAERLLEHAQWVSAVDIRALRPPHGDITPLENAYEPEVARIYDECRRLATAQGARHVETTHLFYAIVVAGGEISRRIFARMQVDADALRESLSGPHQEREGILRVVATQNVLETQQLAFTLARDAGSPSVREQDLLWAVLQKAPHSPKLLELLKRLHIDLARLSEYLAAEYPSPLLASTGTYTYDRFPRGN